MVRDCRGANGPRLLRLAVRLFNPERAKLADLASALEMWEADLLEFEQSGQKIGDTLRTFGLTQLVPLELQKDLMRVNHTLGSYKECRRWLLDQGAHRRHEPSGKPGADTNQVTWEELNSQESTQSNVEYGDELNWTGAGRPERGKGKGKGSIPFEGHCHHCGAYGHRLNQCRKKDAEMEAWKSKGKGKEKGKTGWTGGYGKAGLGGGAKGTGAWTGGGKSVGPWGNSGKGGKGFGKFAPPAWSLTDAMMRIESENQTSGDDAWNSWGLYHVNVKTTQPFAPLANENAEESEDDMTAELVQKAIVQEICTAGSDQGPSNLMTVEHLGAPPRTRKQVHEGELDEVAAWIQDGSHSESRSSDTAEVPFQPVSCVGDGCLE